MDITQIKGHQAQPDVGLKVVRDNTPTPVAVAKEETVDLAEKIVKQQEKMALEKRREEPSKDQMVEKLNRQVSKMNEFVQSVQRDLSFSVDDDSGKTVVKVFNTQTKELVRQIPSEEALLLAERIKENRDETSGMILKVEV